MRPTLQTYIPSFVSILRCLIPLYSRFYIFNPQSTTQSTNIKRSLPRGRFPVGMFSITVLFINPCFLHACPAYFGLLTEIYLVEKVSVRSSLHCPKILLGIWTSIGLFLVFLTEHVSRPFITAKRINVVYIIWTF